MNPSRNRTAHRPRHRFLVGALLGVTLLATACNGNDGPANNNTTSTSTNTSGTATAASDAQADTVTLQLDWVPNTNHTGIYVAEQLGYYDEAGIDLDVLPYAGNTGDTLVAEGRADFAVSFQNSITLSKPAGADIVTVAAIVQHSTEAIGVRADRDDLSTPADLDGKLYAGFGAPFEEPLMQAIIRAAGGTGEFETVVLDTAAYDAVYNGSADFVIPFKTWEGIEAELSGEPFKYFDYVDYGLPDQYSVILIGQPQWLDEHSDVARRFLAATRRGYEYAAEQPAEAAQHLIDANPGVFTNVDLVAESQALMSADYLVDDTGRWGCVDDQQFADYSHFFFESGIVVGDDGDPVSDEPDWASFSDMTYLGC